MILDGSEQQTVKFELSGPSYGHFQSLEINNPAGINFTSKAYVTVTVAVTAGIVTGGYPITIVGALVDPNGGWQVAQTIFPDNPDIPAKFYSDVTFQGNTLLSHDVEINGTVVIDFSGIVDLNGHTLVIHGELSIPSGGKLLMNSETSVLDVNGNATFGGFDVGNNLTARVTRLSGSLSVPIGNSGFRPTGTHRVILYGSEQQTVEFELAGPGNGNFQNLEIDKTGGSVAFISDAYVSEELMLYSSTALLISNGKTLTVSNRLITPPSSMPTITSPTPGTDRFTFIVNGGVDVDGLNFSSADANGLQLNNGVFTAFDNVNFTDAENGGRHLTIEHTSLNSLFKGLTFDNSFGTGNNVSLTDIDGGGDVAITVFDADGDGAGESFEQQSNTAVLNWSGDTDQDGMADDWELAYFGDVNRDGTGDHDSDGLTDVEEFEKSTNPIYSDTDSDGMPDGWENTYSLNPLVDDAEGDKDSDGSSNIREYRAGSSPSDPAEKPSIEIVVPNGGESWKTGTIKSITWGSAFVENVRIEYTTDDGVSWSEIISSTPAADAAYTWILFVIPSDSYQVRISDASDPNLFDYNGDVFSISSGYPGDTNGDGFVDIADAILLMQSLTGAPLSFPMNIGADLDGNEILGFEELLYALQSIAGMRESGIPQTDQPLLRIISPVAEDIDLPESSQVANVSFESQIENFEPNAGGIIQVYVNGFLEQELLTTSFDLELAAGEYDVHVRLVDENKRILSPWAKDTKKIKVKGTGPITLSLSDTSAINYPYQVVMVDVSNHLLQEEIYDTTINDEQLTLARINDTVIGFVLPNLPPGEHNLFVSLGGQEVVLPVLVGELLPIVNPENVILSFNNEMHTTIENLLATIEDTPENADLRALLQNTKDQIQELNGQLNSLTPDQMLELASFIRSNFLEMNSAALNQRLPFHIPHQDEHHNCQNEREDFYTELISFAARAAAAGILLKTAGTSITIPGIGTVPAIVTGAVAGITLASAIIRIRSTAEAAAIWVKCVFDNPIFELSTKDLGRVFSSSQDISNVGFSSFKNLEVSIPKSSNGELIFYHDNPEDFTVHLRYEAGNSYDESLLRRFKMTVNSISDFLPQSILDYVNNLGGKIKIEKADPSLFDIANISDSNIAGHSMKNGEKISIAFSFIDTSSLGELVEGVSFAFDLIDKRDGLTTTFQAKLSPTFPQIVVKRDGIPLASGFCGYNFGDVVIGSIADKAFSIENTGNIDLRISYVLPVNGPPSKFTIPEQPTGTIPPGESKAFTIRFDPLADGDNENSIVIKSDDPNLDEFTFIVRGRGVEFEERTKFKIVWSNCFPGVVRQDYDYDGAYIGSGSGLSADDTLRVWMHQKGPGSHRAILRIVNYNGPGTYMLGDSTGGGSYGELYTLLSVGDQYTSDDFTGTVTIISDQDGIVKGSFDFLGAELGVTPQDECDDPPGQEIYNSVFRVSGEFEIWK